MAGNRAWHPVGNAIRTVADQGPAAAARKATSRLRLAVNAAIIAAKLRVRARRPMGVEESVDFAFGCSRGEATLVPWQVRSEISEFLDFLAADRPGRILEIGTASGGVTFLLSRVAAPDAKILTVDLPGGEFGGGYGLEWLPVLRSLPLKQQELVLIRGDSHQPQVHEKVAQQCDGPGFDLVLIDGDHSYDGVRRDFEMYGPLARPGGLIAFHDVVPGREKRVGGAPRLWTEIKAQSSFSTREFVEDWDQGGWGFGLIRVPEGGLDAAPEAASRDRDIQRSDG